MIAFRETQGKLIPPAVSINAKWRDARVSLTLEGNKWGVGWVGGGGGGYVLRVGWLGSGACSWDLHAFPLVLLQRARKGNCEQECGRKLILRSQSKVAEGGFPCICALGYIIM